MWSIGSIVLLTAGSAQHTKHHFLTPCVNSGIDIFSCTLHITDTNAIKMQLYIQLYQPRAKLTIRHGRPSHVRRAPGWKESPE